LEAFDKGERQAKLVLIGLHAASSARRVPQLRPALTGGARKSTRPHVFQTSLRKKRWFREKRTEAPTEEKMVS
jgi:hypothetical protein